MCFKGSSKSADTKDETPVAPAAVERDDEDSLSTAEEAIARARASRSTGSVRPVARGQGQRRSLIDRGMMSVRYPTGRG